HSVQTKVFDNPLGVPLQVIGTAPHMHLLGTRIRALADAGLPTERCLADIPRWAAVHCPGIEN
ncbi:MAG: hypothetical protein KC457_17725, partial [Myxococcales bacterium]|nr:hypothetical protein [Myxococcales bacterium]